VDNLQLRKFVSYGFNPEFKPVCRQTLKRIMDEKFHIKKEKLKLFLRENIKRLSITADGWTSPAYEPYIGITGSLNKISSFRFIKLTFLINSPFRG